MRVKLEGVAGFAEQLYVQAAVGVVPEAAASEVVGSPRRNPFKNKSEHREASVGSTQSRAKVRTRHVGVVRHVHGSNADVVRVVPALGEREVFVNEHEGEPRDGASVRRRAARRTLAKRKRVCTHST